MYPTQEALDLNTKTQIETEKQRRQAAELIHREKCANLALDSNGDETLTETPITPDEFRLRMKEISGDEKVSPYGVGYIDVEESHMQADGLMSDMLTALGYGQGVKIFEKMGKWYA